MEPAWTPIEYSRSMPAHRIKWPERDYSVNRAERRRAERKEKHGNKQGRQRADGIHR